jgi:hypothetical protein
VLAPNATLRSAVAAIGRPGDGLPDGDTVVHPAPSEVRHEPVTPPTSPARIRWPCSSHASTTCSRCSVRLVAARRLLALPSHTTTSRTRRNPPPVWACGFESHPRHKAVRITAPVPAPGAFPGAA